MITLGTPLVGDLPFVIDAVASWQRDGLPVQVHPGDLGWYERFGSAALASALRVWSRDDDVVAVGFLDEQNLIRMAVAPAAASDELVARCIAEDFIAALDEVLPPGTGVVEARFGPALQGTGARVGDTSSVALSSVAGKDVHHARSLPPGVP